MFIDINVRMRLRINDSIRDADVYAFKNAIDYELRRYAIKMTDSFNCTETALASPESKNKEEAK